MTRITGKRIGPNIPNSIAYLVLTLFCISSIFALLWLLVSSVKSNRDLFSGNLWGFPRQIVLNNYSKAWELVHLRDYLVNSLILVPIVVLLVLIVCAPASYALAKIRFRHSNKLLNFFILGMGIPGQLLLIPVYLQLSTLGLTNSLLGLGIEYVSLSIPFSIFLLYGFFKSFPSELEEASAIDGCKPLYNFIRIVVPLSTPGLITVSIYNFIGIWNEYLFALILIRDQSLRTLSLGVYSMQNSLQYMGDWTTLFAGSIIATVPVLVIYLFMSERIMQGLTAGALKG
jgi:ABC-type glycerol-3-phosphate transport system permease component